MEKGVAALSLIRQTGDAKSHCQKNVFTGDAKAHWQKKQRFFSLFFKVFLQLI